jgi:hypothetical protein
MKPFQNTKHAGRSAVIASAIAAGSAISILGGAAFAVEMPRYDYQGAAGVCQAASPDNEPNLRSEPLGLSNSGTTPAFVTCAIQGSDPTGQRGAYQVLVNVANNGTASQIIRCTLVVVFRKPGETVDRTVYSPRAQVVLPGAGAFISWVPTDLTGTTGGPEISKSGVMCGLPGKTTLQYTGNYYREDVGG